MADMKPSGVRTQHPQYQAMVERWKRCEDAAEGEHAIHKAGTKYLPKLAEETDTDYQARLKRTPFFNAVWRTISGLKGMLFRKSPQRTVPPGIEPFMADVDMEGTPLDLFAQDIAEELLTLGRVGILIDRPPMPLNEDGTALTVAQAEKLGLRPMMQSYDADEVINWKEERINNAMQLTLVVLCEDSSVGDDQFGHSTEERYRVLDLLNGMYRQRVFRIDDKGNDEQVGDDIFPLMNNQPMAYIPFVFIGVDDVGTEVESPPLLDLVDMNLHHYQVSADYEHGCHFSGLPTLFISGYRAEDTSPKIYIGGASANCLPLPESKAYFVETSGNFTALRENLNEKKAEMAVLGARMLEQQQRAVQSADTIKQRAAGENSQLAGMAVVESMGITWALKVMADWSGATGEVKYEIIPDFGDTVMTAQEITARVAGWQMGAPGFSSQELHAQLGKGGVLATDATFDEEQARIGEVSPPAPDMLTAPLSENTAIADMQSIADAIAAIPAPVVTVQAAPADTGMADMLKTMAAQHAAGMAAIADAVAQPQQSPTINVSPPNITVNVPEQPAPNVTINNMQDGKKQINVQSDSSGKITGATVE